MLTETFNHPMRSIAIEIFHTVYETDFGPYHSWSMHGLGGGPNTEAYVRSRAERVMLDLAEYRIPAHIVVRAYHVPYPSEF